MELESIIQTHLTYERKRIEFDPAAKEKSKIWIETIKNAPRSVEAIQTLMDAKEVAMNQTNDILQVRRLDWEWSALLWLQGVIQRSRR
ncbi:hypothetical protein [Nitrososphaera sp.]|uniref:hypothetical protein n=1 Tax=Nitrososphaera sp. TaxID=1971748 RepID=UPI0017C1EC51|nr:hypothetical protein [Nitrososphaera sp.]NWG37821.1 hypothetical protein [Nitrososphaera sp.]